MVRHGIRRLPVLDGERLTGIVTLDDLAVRTGDLELAHDHDHARSRAPRCRSSTSTSAAAEWPGRADRGLRGDAATRARSSSPSSCAAALDLVLCGRNAEQAARASPSARAAGAPVRPAPLDDRAALRRAFGDCAAVINCAGPFARYGEPVVRAAVETGTHYVDTTGEQPYMQRIFDALDDAARGRRGRGRPRDGLRLRARRPDLRGSSPGATSRCASWSSPTRSGLRRDARHDALGAGDAARRRPRLPRRRLAPGRRPARCARASPSPSRSAASRSRKYPSGEIAHGAAPRRRAHVTSLITAGPSRPSPRWRRLVPVTTPRARARAAHAAALALLDRAIDAPARGPRTRQRARGAPSRSCAVAHGEDGSTGRGIVRGTDVYGLTAVTAVHGAALLAAEGYDRTGVLAPGERLRPRARSSPTWATTA